MLIFCDKNIQENSFSLYFDIQSVWITIFSPDTEKSITSEPKGGGGGLVHSNQESVISF